LNDPQGDQSLIDLRLFFAYAEAVGYMKRQAMREEVDERAKGHLHGHAKHPPAWCQTQRLLEWPGCSIEARCGCGSSSSYPCKLMASRYGNGTFVDILQRLRCSRCKAAPNAMYLVAGHHRTFGSGGPDPDWSLPIRLR
jgi:hypothetical protein